MDLILSLSVPLLLLYGLFHYWYGGNGQPMSHDEAESLLQQIAQTPTDPGEIEALRTLISKDDGKEFVMHNLVRWRSKALYPPGYPYNDDPRAADQRYGKAILWPLLRYGNLLIFIGKRNGSFLEQNTEKPWDYVAMVRYRSRRDFLRFVLASSRQDIFTHKWAAIEETHIFPLKPMISLILVRYAAASALALLGFSAFTLLS